VGTLQPLEAAHGLARQAGVPLVVDGQASLGRLAAPGHFDVLVGDARSWGGPGGMGVVALPVRTRWGLPGAADPDEALVGPTRHTPWVPLALAAAEAWQQTEAARDEDDREARALVDLVRAAAAALPDVEVVGDPLVRLPHVLTFSALYADGESLVRGFDQLGFAVSSGSACTASTLEPSHVLAAMGALTHGNVRVSVGRATDDGDVERFLAMLPGVLEDLRARL
jgi:cysteine desulfurase